MSETAKRTKFKPTAIGYILLITPTCIDHRWLLHSFSQAGNWMGTTMCESKKDAQIQRRKRIAYHKRLAAERTKGK